MDLYGSGQGPEGGGEFVTRAINMRLHKGQNLIE